VDDLSQQEFQNHIGGEWGPCASGATAPNPNPADTTDVVGRFPLSDATDGARAVAAAQAAFAAWRDTPISKRAAILFRAAQYLEDHADSVARELTREEGKGLALARDEVLRSAQTIRFYAVEGQSFTGETFVNDDPDMVVYSQREPLGVVTVISPWNFPISIPARKIAPALISGNTVVFKPSSDAPLSGYRLAEAFVQAGLPAGVLNLVIGPASKVGASITTAPAVRAISFTGSTAAGEQIHRGAGLTTRTQMELGGKNPLIVLADADLDRAVDLAVKGGFSLSGQACTGTSRLLVDRKVLPAFTDKLLARMKALTIGNGLDGNFDLGPLATQKQLDTVLSYVAVGKQEATHLLGGDRLTGEGFDRGYYVTPALFTDVTQQMRIAREEIFGPVLSVLKWSNEEDLYAAVNGVEYGLTASIWTTDLRTAHRAAARVQAGYVWINGSSAHFLGAPFGGYKQSGVGREECKEELLEFTQIKNVNVTLD